MFPCAMMAAPQPEEDAVPVFAVTYTYSDDIATREAVRPRHRAFLAGLPGLLLSGPTDNDGALLIFEAGSADEVQKWLDDDPFVTEHVVVERRVAGWDVVLGRAKDRLTD
jgi:uncharacterized protein YciI